MHRACGEPADLPLKVAPWGRISVSGNSTYLLEHDFSMFLDILRAFLGDFWYEKKIAFNNQNKKIRKNKYKE